MSDIRTHHVTVNKIAIVTNIFFVKNYFEFQALDQPLQDLSGLI